MDVMSKAGTIFDEIWRRAAENPDSDAILAHGRSPLSYKGLRAHLLKIGRALFAAGIRRGDRVAVVAPNGAEMGTACLSVMACASAVPFNPDLKQPEYEALIDRLAPALLLVRAAADHPAAQAAQARGLPFLRIETATADPAGIFRLAGLAALGTQRAGTFEPSEPGDEALVLQTSGTTSGPKTVPLTQANLLVSARNLINSLRLGVEDRALNFLPMFHIGGILDMLVAPLMAGGVVYCCNGFSVEETLRDMRAFEPTWIQAVPVMFEAMIEGVEAAPGSLPTRMPRFARSVSAPLPPATLLAFEASTGIPVIEIYGMTETAGVITSTPLPPADRIPGSVGFPAGPEVRIRDGATGRDVAVGETGEVIVRGGNVMAGYADAPEDNAQCFVEGWFRTGDLGRFDANGRLYLVGRIKELVNRGGEKISPIEIDNVLREHPEIVDAATYGVPHPSLGEDVAAAVVIRPGSRVDATLLAAWLRGRIAHFKIPRFFHFVESIPRGANGKLQRGILADRFTASEAEAARGAEHGEPEGPVARLLASLWGEILKVDRVGPQDDFFHHGGDSLKAASVVNALQQRLGETFYVSSVFDAPTPAAYEAFMRHHYPDVVARLVGESIRPREAVSERVSPAMVTRLREMIAQVTASPWHPATHNPRAIFILSAPRSGSTLLRAMMGGHPDLFAPPELYLLSYPDLADRKEHFAGAHASQLEGAVRAVMQAAGISLDEACALLDRLEQEQCPTARFYQMLQDWVGERILVDKTPAYAVDPATLQQAEATFDAPFYVHLIRHPYGMIRSFEEIRLDQLWLGRLVGKQAEADAAQMFGRRQLAEMIWMILNANILDFLKDIPAERQCRISYEALVETPEASMRGLCEGIGLDFAAAMLDPTGSRKERMTDGLHDVSRMIGDPKFHLHAGIDANAAHQWRHSYDVDFLSDECWKLARSLGYVETVSESQGREDYEI